MFKVYFIHGLFGENFLAQNPSVSLLSPYEFNQKALQGLEKESVVIGYSLGGRVLLRELYKLQKIPFRKIHLISTHFGLRENQIVQRVELEDKIISHFEKAKINSFWNSLEIFKGDPEIAIDTSQLDFYREIFEKNRLSQQPCYLEFIQDHQDKFEFHLGEFDIKYRELYELSGLSNITIHSGSGHRGPINQLINIYTN